MEEISREEAIEQLQRHSYWTSGDYSWIDDVCDKAISDMQKLEKIENVISVFSYKRCAFDDMCNDIPDCVLKKLKSICEDR